MQTPRRRRWNGWLIVALLALAGLSLTVAPALAVRDHLQCFRVKAGSEKGRYTADLLTDNDYIPPVQPGCTLQTPAKYYCIDAAAENVSPPPPGARPGKAGQAYLCYKAKCNTIKTGFNVADRFGDRPVEIRSTSLLCAPIPAPLECAAGWLACGDGADAACIEPSSDERHCGGCGNACAPNALCAFGSCVVLCPSGQSNCDGACYDLLTDEAQCGACGNACLPGRQCIGGQCECLADETFCPSFVLGRPGECADLETNAAHCGTCSNRCAVGEACVAGQCECPAGQQCGCPAGLTDCDGACYDLLTDRTRCGSCNAACLPMGSECIAGTCQCPAGDTLCPQLFAPSVCVDLQTNESHCGACSAACGVGEACSDGTCGPPP